MKSTLITFIFICFSFLSIGNVNIDSLISILHDDTSSDQIKLNAINQICSKSYMYHKPDSAFISAKLVYDFAKEKGLQKEMATALSYMAISSINKADNSNAIEYIKSSIAINEDIKDELVSLTNSKQNQRIQTERLGFLGAFILILCSLGYFVKSKFNKFNLQQEKLKSKVEILKEKLASQSVSVSSSIENKARDGDGITLDKTKLEKAINSKIGESSWMILNLIFKNPTSSNKEIANEVSLSLEGVSSSLRRMYIAFEVKTASNKKIALIQKAVRISIEE